MISKGVSALTVVLGIAAMASPPAAYAADHVTYELTSDSIGMMYGIEYVDATGRKLLEQVPLPWRLDVTLGAATAAPLLPDQPGAGAQLRADWRPVAGPSRWVVASIYSNGTLLCRSAIDVGNITCYGNTPYINSV